MLISQITAAPPTGSPVTLGMPDGVPGYTLETVTLDPAPLAIVTRDLPGVTGGVVLPGRREARTVSVSGTILATSALEAHEMRRAIVRVFGDHGKDPIALRFTPEGVELQLLGYTDGTPTFTDLGGNLLGYTVTVICPDPVATSTVSQSTTVPVGGGSALADNFGDADVWPTITVTVAGNLTGVTITNAAAGGKSIALSGLSVDAGTQLVIVTTPGRESVKAGGVSVMDKRTSVSRFWPIKPGSNTLTASYTGSGSAPTVEVTYKEGWVS